MVPLKENALLPLEEQEGALVVATAAPATAITTVTLPDGWTRRVVRLRITNLGNARRSITLYSGDAVDTDRTQLGAAISLSNYQTILMSEDDLKKMIKKFRAASSQNVNLYGIIDGGTDGIQVDVTYLDELL